MLASEGGYKYFFSQHAARLNQWPRQYKRDAWRPVQSSDREAKQDAENMEDITAMLAKVQGDLQKKQAERDAKAAELASREAAVKKKEAELTARESQLTAREVALTSRELELKSASARAAAAKNLPEELETFDPPTLHTAHICFSMETSALASSPPAAEALHTDDHPASAPTPTIDNAASAISTACATAQPMDTGENQSADTLASSDALASSNTNLPTTVGPAPVLGCHRGGSLQSVAARVDRQPIFTSPAGERGECASAQFTVSGMPVEVFDMAALVAALVATSGCAPLLAYSHDDLEQADQRYIALNGANSS